MPPSGSQDRPRTRGFKRVTRNWFLHEDRDTVSARDHDQGSATDAYQRGRIVKIRFDQEAVAVQVEKGTKGRGLLISARVKDPRPAVVPEAR